MRLHRYPEARAASQEALIYLVGSKREHRDTISAGQRLTKRGAILGAALEARKKAREIAAAFPDCEARA